MKRTEKPIGRPRKKAVSQFGLSLPTATWQEVALYEATQTQVGEMTGLTQAEVSQASTGADPTFTKNKHGKYILKDATTAYCRYLKHKAKHSKKETMELLDEEKTRAQISNIQMRNEKKVLEIKREVFQEVKIELLRITGALQEFLKIRGFDGKEVADLIDGVKKLDEGAVVLSEQDREGTAFDPT